MAGAWAGEGGVNPSSLALRQMDLGWRALAQRAFGLSNVEVAALQLLMRRRGHVVPFSEFTRDAELRGWGAGAIRNPEQSDASVRKRIERLRRKLSEAGCPNAIKTEHCEGYSIHPLGARRVQVTLESELGVDDRKCRTARPVGDGVNSVS